MNPVNNWSVRKVCLPCLALRWALLRAALEFPAGAWPAACCDAFRPCAIGKPRIAWSLATAWEFANLVSHAWILMNWKQKHYIALETRWLQPTYMSKIHQYVLVDAFINKYLLHVVYHVIDNRLVELQLHLGRMRWKLSSAIDNNLAYYHNLQHSFWPVCKNGRCSTTTDRMCPYTIAVVLARY